MPEYWRNTISPSSALKMETVATFLRKVSIYLTVHTALPYPVSSFSPEDGGSTFLRNVCTYLQVHAALQR